MKIKLIEIDTNNQNAGKFRNNIELFDLIAPNIVFLVDDSNEVYPSDIVDWNATRPYFEPANNGHCIYFKEGGYIAAYEFKSLAVRLDTLGMEDSMIYTLSDLCDELSEKNNIISWLTGISDGSADR